MGRRLWILLALLVVVTATALLLRSGPPKQPDIVLITIDTLRADALGAYGNTKGLTPHLDAFAASGIVFENATSHLPETRPSHASILTGLYPRTHGVVANNLLLPQSALTLPERLKEAGYRTAASVGVTLLSPTAGFAQGFDTFHWPSDQNMIRAYNVVLPAIEWLESTTTDEPIFLWIHVFDPHQPYDPVDLFDIHSPPEIKERIPQLSWHDFRSAAQANGGDLPRVHLERALALYDAEVATVDYELGRLIDALSKTGRDDAAIIVTADHGECFSNGIYFEHSNCLYDGAIHVPLMASFPGEIEPGLRQPEPYELIDIAPTVLRWAGLEPDEAIEGEGLFAAPDEWGYFQHPLYRAVDVVRRQETNSLIKSVAGDPSRPIVGDRELLGARSSTWKYFWSDLGEELYYLPDDPEESTNLAESDDDTRSDLRRTVNLWRQQHPLILQGDGNDLTEEMRKQLEALGYL
ncbi:MAG: sulfatase [Acidobacteriota bacterium]